MLPIINAMSLATYSYFSNLDCPPATMAVYGFTAGLVENHMPGITGAITGILAGAVVTKSSTQKRVRKLKI